MKTARRLKSSAWWTIILGMTGWLLAGGASVRAADAAALELKPDAFLKSWLVLGPIPISSDNTPTTAAQTAAFAQDWLAEAGGETGVEPKAGALIAVAGQELKWQRVESSGDVVDLNRGGAAQNFCVAYAAAEVEAPEAGRVVLGIGSDDGIKVWLNGKLIHENWTGRPVQTDDDLVAADLQKGRNRLLVKIQNQQGDWGFACRSISKETRAKKFVEAASRGELDDVKLLLGGVSVNAPGPIGLSAYQAAHLHGRKEVAEFLRRNGADTSAPLPAPETMVEILLASVFKSNGPGAAVLVAKDGKILFQRAYGLADIGNHVPAAPDTRFRIGSISKQFTAAAILKLYEDGKLSLHDRLTKFVPDFPRGDEVTIHHLLTHTSGIRSYTGKPDFIGNAPVGIKAEDLINSFKNDPYDFDPGQRWLYNNSGFFLLGYIIEKISGKSYGEYLRDTFFEPLGMKESGVHEAAAILENEATGYSYENGKVKKALNWDMSKAGGAGALYSTVRDLYRWNEAVWNGKVLKESSLKAAFTPVKVASDDANEPKTTGYGYGWGIDSLRGTQEIGHGGGLNGFLSYLFRLPEEEFSVVVLVNCAPPLPGGNPAALAHEIAELYLGEKLAPRESPKIDPNVTPKDLELIAGRYDYGAGMGGVLEVTLEYGKLFAQLGKEPKFEIFAKSATNFFWKVVPAEVTFVKNEQGQVIRAIHRRGAVNITAPRLPEVKVAAVDPSIYDRYAGRYDCGGGKSILTITREGDRLFAEVPGNTKLEIFPKSETEYFCRLINAEVTFIRDSNGKVVQATLNVGGQKTEAPRIE